MSTISCGEVWVLNPNLSGTLIILISINGLSLCSAIFLNLSAIIVMWRIDYIPGCNRSILFNLSLVDLLSGLLPQVLWVTFMATQLSGYQFCPLANALTFCGLMLFTVSFLILVLASIERYMCIFHPFVYERVSGSGTFKIIGCIWLTALSTSILYLFPVMKTPIHVGIAVIVSMGCCVIAFIYGRVFHLALKVRQEIQDQTASVNNWPKNRHGRRQRGSIKMTAFVVALSLLCYCPYGISLFIATFTNTKINSKVFCVFWTIALANTSIDPICYFVFNKTLKQKLLALWRCETRDDDMIM